MDTQTVYCPGCNHKVRLTVTPEHRDGHANLAEGAEVVCLDFGGGCADGRCPMTGSPGIVMGVRLARSHLRDEAFDTLHTRCQACGNVVDMEVLDDRYAFCPVCESTQQWVMLELDPDTQITFTTP